MIQETEEILTLISTHRKTYEDKLSKEREVET